MQSTFAPSALYILNSTSDPAGYSTGMTSNIRQRLAEHDRRACRHASRWVPWKVIVVVAFASEERALEFERYLKSGSGCAFAVRHFR
jgi:putative endonuclease